MIVLPYCCPVNENGVEWWARSTPTSTPTARVQPSDVYFERFEHWFSPFQVIHTQLNILSINRMISVSSTLHIKYTYENNSIEKRKLKWFFWNSLYVKNICLSATLYYRLSSLTQTQMTLKRFKAFARLSGHPDEEVDDESLYSSILSAFPHAKTCSFYSQILKWLFEICPLKNNTQTYMYNYVTIQRYRWFSSPFVISICCKFW